MRKVWRAKEKQKRRGKERQVGTPAAPPGTSGSVSIHRYTAVRSGVIYVHVGWFLRLLAKTVKTKQEAGQDQLSSCASRTRACVCVWNVCDGVRVCPWRGMAVSWKLVVPNPSSQCFLFSEQFIKLEVVSLRVKNKRDIPWKVEKFF